MKVKVSIMGMHCASCASNIERSLKKIAGVKECSVSLMTRKGMIECEKDVSDDEIKKAVSRAGYKTIQIERG